jgi:cyclophilin family peptidyl-prolyl cis-trans isomerase/HEAT repeat protein
VFLQSVEPLLDDPDPDVPWKAAYALAEVEVEGRADLLRRAARSEDGLVRFFACGGLARLAATKEAAVEELLPLLDDPDPHLAAIAAGGLGRLRDPAAMPRLLYSFHGRLGAADFHVRRAALAAAVDLALAERKVDDGGDLRRAIEQAWRDPSLMVRGEAMRARVRLDELGGDAKGLMETFGVLPKSRDVHEEVAALRALGAAPAITAKAATELLEDVAEDADPYLASEALAALASIAERTTGEHQALDRKDLRALAIARAGAPDLAVAGSALELLKVVGSKEDVAVASDVFGRLAGSDNAEARATAVHVGVALAGKEAIELLRRARSDESPAVVAAAKEEWRKLALPEDPPRARALEGRPGADDDAGGLPSSIALEPGVDFLSEADRPRIALHFESPEGRRKGVVVIELLREEAPRHVSMMLHRVRAGRCDGLPIHRVVTGFVVQGLDPRGDGWGSGGVFLRDEINRVPYLRGAVGMPNAGPDSAGCQLFVTVVPTPHLDGRYTVFGWVVAGMEVVDALDVGDRCAKAEVLR